MGHVARLGDPSWEPSPGTHLGRWAVDAGPRASTSAAGAGGYCRRAAWLCRRAATRGGSPSPLSPLCTGCFSHLQRTGAQVRAALRGWGRVPALREETQLRESAGTSLRGASPHPHTPWPRHHQASFSKHRAFVKPYLHRARLRPPFQPSNGTHVLYRTAHLSGHRTQRKSEFKGEKHLTRHVLNRPVPAKERQT